MTKVAVARQMFKERDWGWDLIRQTETAEVLLDKGRTGSRASARSTACFGPSTLHYRRRRSSIMASKPYENPGVSVQEISGIRYIR